MEFFERAIHWKQKNFLRSMKKGHIMVLEQLGFPFGPDIKTYNEKKEAFTRWVRDHPRFRYANATDAIIALARWRSVPENLPEKHCEKDVTTRQVFETTQSE